MGLEEILDLLADKVAERLAESPAKAQSRLLTVDAAAQYLSTTPQAIRKRISRGQLPTVKVGERTVYVDRVALDRQIEGGKISA